MTGVAATIMIALSAFTESAADQMGRGAQPDPVDIVKWIGPDDYPSDAARAGEEGEVGVRLVVDADGLVRACSVTLSSGSASLDSAACRLTMERARFKPARDRAGNAVDGTYETKFGWLIPAVSNGPVGMLKIEKAGDRHTCALLWQGEWRRIKVALCDGMVESMIDDGTDPVGTRQFTNFDPKRLLESEAP